MPGQLHKTYMSFDLATDIDNIFNKIRHIYFAALTCVWRVVKNWLPRECSLVDMGSRSVYIELAGEEVVGWGGGEGLDLVCSLYFVW